MCSVSKLLGHGSFILNYSLTLRFWVSVTDNCHAYIQDLLCFNTLPWFLSTEMGCGAKPRNVSSPFPGRVRFTIFFCFLGEQVVGSILKQTWCWPLCLCPIPHHDSLQQMGHAPVTNLTPAEAHLHLPWSTWLLHLCPVTADFLSAAPQYILLTFWSWQVRIFVFNRGG